MRAPHRFIGKTLRFFVCVAAVAGFAATPLSSRAATMVYTSTLTINNTGDEMMGMIDPSAIAVNDKFVLSFTLDTSVVDTDGSTGYYGPDGAFTGAVLSYSLTRVGTNTGTWDPGLSTKTGGTLTDGAQNSSTNRSFFLEFTYSGGSSVPYSSEFEGSGTTSFQEILFNFVANPPGSISDTGTGQTLASRLPDSSSWLNAYSMQLRFDGGMYMATATATPFSVSAVPEPSTVALGCIGIVALGASVLRRRRAQS